MIVALLVLIVCGGAAYLIYQVSEPSTAPPVDPEAALRAAADLHRIRRRLDVAELQHEQRRDASRLKRELAETLGVDHDAP